LMDEPTSHLDLESITALNNALTEYKGSMIFTSHDHELTHTVANRIVEVGPFGMLDKLMSYDDYLNDEKIKEQRDAIYGKLKA
jgi:ATPase subunit of ABC transporter with duplicated ATPase domains